MWLYGFGCVNYIKTGVLILKIYISTFTPGFETIINSILPVILIGSKVLKVYSGLVSYEYNGNPVEISKIFIFNNSYHVIRLFAEKNLTFQKMVNEVLDNKNDYLNQNEFSCGVKTFRVRFVKENQFEKVDKQVVLKAEHEISKATNLKIDRLNPESEFWYIVRRENIAYYAQLLFKRHFTEKNLNKGELRPEFALLMAYWAQVKLNDVVMDPFAGYGSIPLQLYENFRFGKLIINDNDSEKVDHIKKRFEKNKANENVEITCKDAMYLSDIKDKTIDKIITDPPWGIYENIENIENFYCDILVEIKRILKDEGEIIVLSAKKIEFENAALSCGLIIIDKIDTLVNGKKASLFKVVKNLQTKVNEKST